MNRKLRQKAQEVLKKKGIIDQSLYEKDIETLVEELSIYQIELEQQNNELRETQERLIKTNERYTDLFNNAPIGYLILDKNYTIKKINNTLCHILEYDMNELEGTSFVKLIEPSFQDIFYLSFRSTLDQDITNTSDIKLKKAKNGILFAHLIMDAESLPEE